MDQFGRELPYAVEGQRAFERACWDEAAMMRVAEQKGEARGREEVAKNLLLHGVSRELIIAATGLTPEELENLPLQ